MLNKFMVYIVLTLIVAIAVYTYCDLALFLEKKSYQHFLTPRAMYLMKYGMSILLEIYCTRYSI